VNRSLWTNVRSDDVNCQKAIIGAYFLLFWHMATIYHGNGRQHAGYRRVRRALGIGGIGRRRFKAPRRLTYAGFVNGDGVINLSTPAVLSTTATSASPVGTYPIAVSGATDPNYTITFVAGVLTVDNSGGAGSTPATPHGTGGTPCGIGSGIGAFSGLLFLLLRAYLAMMTKRRDERAKGEKPDLTSLTSTGTFEPQLQGRP
jgi:hypothetical protein